MEKTWTVVRFEDENVVEAVPTTWISNNTCYWPPYTTEKVLKAIKDYAECDRSWTSYEVYVFKNSTSESYQACRLKAKKAEDTSDLTSDNNKRKRTPKRNYDSNCSLELNIESPSQSKNLQACKPKSKMAEDISADFNSRNKKKIKKGRNVKYVYSDSSVESDNESTVLPSPPNLHSDEHSDAEIIEPADKNPTTEKEESYTQNNMRCNNYLNNSVENNTCAILNLKDKCSKKQNCTTSDQKSSKDKSRKENTSFGKRYDSLNNDIPGSSNTNICASNNMQQRYLQIGKETNNNVQTCTCCPIHKNSDERFRRVFKELFLIRELTKECCEELKVTIMEKGNVNVTNENEPTFLSTFNFPLQNIQELEEVEQYLKERNRFQSTVRELSKIGGTTPYDFIKRCLSLLFTNRFAEQYSWYGAKKKQIFGKLHLANVLLESAQLCKAATTRKEVEEAIKAWLRRAKERAVKEEK